MALTRERILDTARTVLSTYGLGDLSMRRLASELDVAPGALYYHVKNKQQLLSLLATQLLSPPGRVESREQMNPPASRREVKEEVLAIAEGMVSALSEVTDAADVVAFALAIRPESVPQRAHIAELLSIAGLDDRQSDWGARTILSTVCGFVTHAQTRAQVLREPVSAEDRRGFAFGLDAVISGLLA